MEGKRLISAFTLGDMKLCYVEDEKQRVGMHLLPVAVQQLELEKTTAEEPLVAVHLVGDDACAGYSQGRTLRGSNSMKGYRFDHQAVKQEAGSLSVETVLRHEAGYSCTHSLTYREGSRYATVRSSFYNGSDRPVTLELLTSFTLGSLTMFEPGDGVNTLQLTRIRSCWSAEGRMETESIEHLHLEPSWTMHDVHVERWGQVGSMPVRGYFPFAAVTDTKVGVSWGVELTGGGSWQLEAGRQDEGFSLAGGQADREAGHWLKTLQSGETFTSEDAILTCGICPVEEICERLTEYTQDHLNLPESEQALPPMFNEYCTTWGMPQEELIAQMAEKLKGRGLRYFVIDAGWYADVPGQWNQFAGSWNVSKALFPHGMEKTVQTIRDCGMLPGIWFEMESIGRSNPMFSKTEWMLHRDGVPLTVGDRRFWDLRLPEVQDYLAEKVIHFLQQYGFRYIKIDYNECLGIGVDGAESLGEGLRLHLQAVQAFMGRLRREVPELVLEICSSGGHRLVPSFMSLASMGSFSDAHECEEIPIIAANMHTMILPRQSQIWAVLKKEHSLRRIAYLITGGMLGRLCLSGDILQFTEEQWDFIQQGIDFYREAAPVICRGSSKRYGESAESWRHPEGWQALVRQGAEKSLAVVHSFHKAPDTVRFPIPEGKKVEKIYARPGIVWAQSRDQLILRGLQDMDGVAVLLK